MWVADFVRTFIRRGGAVHSGHCLHQLHEPEYGPFGETQQGSRRTQGDGCRRGLLIRQFLGESLLMSVLALFLALVLVSVVMPFFNEMAGKKLVLNWL